MTEETNPDILPSEETANTPAPEVNDEPIAAAAPEAPRAEENPAPAAAPATAPTAEPAAPLVAEPVPEPVAEPAAEEVAPGPVESFADVLKAFESTHTHRAASKQLEGTVVSLSAEQVILDVGYKMEGVLPRSSFPNNAEGVKTGDRFAVSITGRNEEGYYELSRFRVAQPRDWSALETAFADKVAVAGTVTEVVKGGLSVDVGVRAFMPVSRSGTRDAAELEALVGQQIQCRITKLDVTDENVVVDRRAVLEEQAQAEMANRRAAMREGDTVTGTVRTLMPYGAFVNLSGPGFGDGWPAARERYLLQPCEQAGRRAHRRAASASQDTQNRPALREDFARPQATAARAMGDGGGALPARPAHYRHRYAAHRLWRVCRA